MKYLLDVNLLLAAIWSSHQQHAKADAWLRGKQLATCPITDLGFLRISTHPRAFNSDMRSARMLLEKFAEAHAVEFLPAALPVLQSLPANSDAVTDMYLAELAAANRMKLATLDGGIRHKAVELLA